MEHVALYRLYRPMDFDDIVEQSHAVAALRQSVISKRIGHAYLFCGTRGTGKTSIAKVFSRAINCLHPVNGNPCNECEICKGVIDGSLLDVIEMDAASNNSVDNIRRICDEVMFMPAKAKYKVYIIDEVHMLSSGAFNALLKTLEEPPAHAVFLLATTEPHRIPATILSRCQRYDFRRITSESIVKRLSYIAEKENISIEPDALSAIATIGDGALRDSVSLLDQVSTTSEGKTITRDDVMKIIGLVDEVFLNKFATALLEGRASDLLPLTRELIMDGRDLIRFTLDLAQYFRNILVTRISPSPKTLIESTSAAIAEMTKLGKRTDSDTLLFFISRLSDLVSELKWSPSLRTSFEITMLRLAARGDKIAPPVIAPAAPEAVAPKKTETLLPPIAQPKAAPAPAVKEPVMTPPPVIDTPVVAPKKQEDIPATTPPPVLDDISAPAPIKEAPLVKNTPSVEVPVAAPPPVLDDISTPPSLDDISAPPPASDLDFMIPPPVSEADFLAPPPVLDPTPSGSPEEEAPVIEPKESAPSAEELAHTVPTSPNLHKAFATDYVSEGQHTNLVKAAKGPDVRVPDMPADVLAPEGASQASAPKRSNLQQVIRHEEDHSEQARKDFVDFLKDNHPFEYLYMCDCSVFWKDQTVWCIMPNSFAQSIEEIKTNPAVLPNLLKLCQKYEPALLHARVATKDEYEKIKDDDGPSDIPESKGQPDWVKAIEKASQENGIPIDHVTDM